MLVNSFFMPQNQLHSFLQYLELEKNYSQHTVTAYKKDLEAFAEFIEFQYQGQNLKEVAYPQVRSWLVQLVEEGLSNSSINRKISSLKSYYKFLQKTKQLEISPLAKHKALKISKKLQVPFSEKEIDLALDAFPAAGFEEIRNKLMVVLLYSTGIRRSELINIKLQNVDVPGRSLKVIGKGNKERFIPLLPFVVEVLEEYLPERKAVENSLSEGYLFLTGKGVKMYDSLVYRTINNYFRGISSKLKKSPHILRHSFATHLLNQGAHINAVKELLGHSSLAATQVYTHNSMAELNRVYNNAHPRSRKKGPQ
ncbi:integrase/recombinase XerC [Salinimicrobium catena]|uniref:Tyrosine recombinase XerC n=2 Tax=Salinimicrobium catena TaxID=390640 RepID=A0A1H5NRA4_9FLAO|nr:integrase/recombinase XerC [Salinimicrobium catena]SEF04125.1 integrase/recombinase XerC [Salinimicrobium catena]